MIPYKIVAFNKETAQINVVFEGFPATTVDIPIKDDNTLIVGAELDAWIKGFAPVAAIERTKKLNAGITNAHEIESLITSEPSVGQEKTNTVEQIRGLRNILLTQSDWTQLEDAPITAEKKAEWAAYRQLLRDVPQNYTVFDDSFDFPAEPT